MQKFKGYKLGEIVVFFMSMTDINVVLILSDWNSNWHNCFNNYKGTVNKMYFFTSPVIHVFLSVTVLYNYFNPYGAETERIISLCHQHIIRQVYTFLLSKQTLYCWLTSFKFTSSYILKKELMTGIVWYSFSLLFSKLHFYDWRQRDSFTKVRAINFIVKEMH